MARSDSMAVIDSALASAQSDSTPEPSVAAPPDLSVVEEDKELTTEEKNTLEKQRQIEQAQEDLLGKEEADALKEEQQRQKAQETFLTQTAERLRKSVTKNATKTGNAIVRLPTPGSIMTPLILLIIFFFILLQFNGFTRVQWGWMVLTGNAYVSDNASGSGTGGGPPPSNTPPATPQPQPLASQLDLSGYTSLAPGGTLGGF